MVAIATILKLLFLGFILLFEVILMCIRLPAGELQCLVTILYLHLLRPSTMASTPQHEYNMGHTRRGLALVINNEIFEDKRRRVGTEVDKKSIEEAFKALQFEVESYDNLTKREMKTKMKEVAEREQYHKHSDCFVCVILSYGDEGTVFGKDGSVEIEQLVNPFKGHECKALAGKPKLFFIQACREQALDDKGTTTSDALGVVGDVGEQMEEVTYRIPTEADFLMAYSSLPGYHALLNTFNGSWFIQALCAVLKEYGTTLDLMTMMTRVNQKVAYEFESAKKTKQIPCITSMLTKDVYFRLK